MDTKIPQIIACNGCNNCGTATRNGWSCAVLTRTGRHGLYSKLWPNYHNYDYEFMIDNNRNFFVPFKFFIHLSIWLLLFLSHHSPYILINFIFTRSNTHTYIWGNIIKDEKLNQLVSTSCFKLTELFVVKNIVNGEEYLFIFMSPLDPHMYVDIKFNGWFVVTEGKDHGKIIQRFCY